MRAPRVIKIAILAMGGEGGGVLADWLVDLAEANGHVAQSTSVPGVAQRTGATIYYVEMFPQDAVPAGAAPVLALMPAPGDVDVVLASELMEAGRAVQRGLVTPGRTTLIASTHRVYAIAERSAPNDARVPSGELLAHAQQAANRFVGFDMAAMASEHHSVISAVLLGALAGAGVLPFERAAFEATIERSGVGVKPSLAAFAAAVLAAQGSPAAGAEPLSLSGALAPDAQPTARADMPGDTSRLLPALRALLERARVEWPLAPDWTVLKPALARLVDYQDLAYGHQFLDRLQRFAHHAPEHPDAVRALMRHLALWMSYEDVVRVADLKTRDTRFGRVHAEVAAGTASPIVAIDEFLHPRLEEIAETLPLAWGRWLLASGAPRRWVERHLVRARVHRTSSLRGFLALRALAALRGLRRRSLRYALEWERIEAWLDQAHTLFARDAALALEWLACQSLVRGYGDTHARGVERFSLLLDHVRTHPHLAAADLRALREAAQADESGEALRHALAQRVHSDATSSDPIGSTA